MELMNEDLSRPLVEQTRPDVIKRGFMKYLMAQEFFERVAMKGVQTILALFLLESLRFNEVVATELVHLFLIGSFVSPLLGSCVSDGYTGNYAACYIFSFCELLGHVLLTMSAAPVASWQRSSVNHVLVPFALCMIVLGSGALKPCQITFGGDQMNQIFRKENGSNPSDLLSNHEGRASHEFFSVYYMAVNLGTLLALLVSPLIRVKGHGNYLYAFLMPACSMALCILCFWLGRNHYFYRPIKKLIGASNTQPGFMGSEQEAAKLSEDGAEDKKDVTSERATYWQDLKDALYVLTITSPCTFFTAMFFQTSSTWVFQARTMNGYVPWLGGLTIQPDQMPVLNPILVILIIPLMDNVVYPQSEKYFGVLPNLKRMVLAIFIASLSFVISGVLQMVIESNLSEEAKGLHSLEQADVSVLWQIPQYFLISLAETLMFIPAIDWGYREAPESMKTVVQAVLHVLSAIGNLITITVVAIIGTGGSKVTESFVFAALGVFGTGLMSFLSYFYVTKETRTARRREIQKQ